ncbi:MAG: MBL fold metallo-hydrolase [Cocleimonas sp.]
MNSTLKFLFQPLLSTSLFSSLSTLLVALILLSASPSIFAKENTSPDPLASYPIQKIAKHTWAIFGPKETPNEANQGFMNNPAFVVTDKSVVVFDPGSSVHIGKSLITKIKKVTDKPITHVFNSHIHGDHWLATDAIQLAYPDVVVYAHPVMLEEAKAGEGDSWIKLMSSLTAGATDGTKVVLPTRVLEDQQVVRIDNISIKSHLSELSHTKTDAMFQIIEEKILITGDNSFNQRMPRMDDGSFVGNIQSMENALGLDIEQVIPGHGPLGGKEILSAYKDLLSIVYKEVKVQLDEDLEAFEMKPIIIEKLDSHKGWTNFEDSIGKLISIAVLEAESE